MAEQRPAPTELELAEAAEMLRLPPEGVEALLAGGYLRPAGSRGGAPTFALGELKAFLARNAADSAGDGSLESLLAELEEADPTALIDALDGRSADMARRAFDIFAQVFPESTSWSRVDVDSFVQQATERFEAILAVTRMGDEIDRDLVTDLEDIGSAAARSGTPLPQILVVLRISRDLVVQTAVELSEERGRHWGLALSLVLTRVLPAIDRLTDSIAQGYWAAVVGREEDARARFQSVVEQASDGIFEIDPDGTIRYVNAAMASILGISRSELEGAQAGVVFAELGTEEVEALLMAEEPTGASLEVRRPDGQLRRVEARTFPRQEQGEVVAHQGVFHDVTAATELEERKNEFLRLVTNELRQPLTTILGLGATLVAYGEDLPGPRVARVGSTIHRHAERLTRLADDLYDLSRLASHDLVVNPRRCALAKTVESAVRMLGDLPSVVRVEVDPKLVVVADERRLERAVATAVEHAADTGVPPVVISARAGTGVAHLTVDHGGEVEIEDAGDARGGPFSPGLGLPLVQGLIEAMGGKAVVEPTADGGTRIRLTLPTPPV